MSENKSKTLWKLINSKTGKNRKQVVPSKMKYNNIKYERSWGICNEFANCFIVKNNTTKNNTIKPLKLCSV